MEGIPLTPPSPKGEGVAEAGPRPFQPRPIRQPTDENSPSPLGEGGVRGIRKPLRLQKVICAPCATREGAIRDKAADISMLARLRRGETVLGKGTRNKAVVGAGQSKCMEKRRFSLAAVPGDPPSLCSRLRSDASARQVRAASRRASRRTRNDSRSGGFGFRFRRRDAAGARRRGRPRQASYPSG